MDSVKSKVSTFVAKQRDNVSLTNLDILKSEITQIVNEIDVSEESYKELLSKTDDSIEKGFKDGEEIKVNIENRYRGTQDRLVEDLNNKKAIVKAIEGSNNPLFLRVEEDIIKGHTRGYADSIVRNEKGDILMLLRNYYSDIFPNRWGLPGGKIEKDEETDEAAKRELLEETGLKADSCHKTAVKKLSDGNTIYYYNVYAKSQSLIALDEEEHMNYSFMSVDEIKSRPESDFIGGLKGTLLSIVDKKYEKYVDIVKAVETVGKGFINGSASSEDLSKATDTYNDIMSMKYETEDNENE